MRRVGVLNRVSVLIFVASWGLLTLFYLQQMDPTRLAATCASLHNLEAADLPTGSNPGLIVEYGDSIYKTGEWDASPVVIEEYKLVFFTTAKVGCTHWKQLFRRMMGIKNWKVEGTPNLIPWNNELNGLKYLYDFDRETASRMMTDPDWTRAIIVRDPKERFLSAYLDKAFHETFVQKACCPYKGGCVKPARESPAGFLKLIQKCDNAHWRPQSARMEDKYWPYINFIGHMETVAEDARRLLQKIGAWEEYGASGWGSNGTLAVFQSKAGGRSHATGAQSKLDSLVSPSLEHSLDEFYHNDYTSPFLGIKKTKIHEIE